MKQNGNYKYKASLRPGIVSRHSLIFINSVVKVFQSSESGSSTWHHPDLSTCSWMSCCLSTSADASLSSFSSYLSTSSPLPWLPRSLPTIPTYLACCLFSSPPCQCPVYLSIERERKREREREREREGEFAVNNSRCVCFDWFCDEGSGRIDILCSSLFAVRLRCSVRSSARTHITSEITLMVNWLHVASGVPFIIIQRAFNHFLCSSQCYTPVTSLFSSNSRYKNRLPACMVSFPLYTALWIRF